MKKETRRTFFLPEDAISWFTLGFIFLVLIGFFLSYENVWMNVECPRWKQPIRQLGGWPKLAHIRLAFSSDVFEANYFRTSRPLSHLFEIFDSLFRLQLWKKTVPHPSLSLTYILAFLLSPALLYRFLRNLGTKVSPAVFAVSLYLISAGNLSTTAMLFRPAKQLACFSIILCLYLASKLELQRRAADPRLFRRFLALTALILVLFFVDETGILIWPTLALFFPALVFGKQRRIPFLALPPAYYVIYRFVMPKVFMVMYPLNAKAVPYGDTPFGQAYNLAYWINWSKGFLYNLRITVIESFGLASLSKVRAHWQMGLFILAYGAFIFLIYSCWKNRKRLTQDKWFLLKQVGFLVFLVGFHSYMMTLVGHKAWGIYYYGAYLSLFVALLFAAVLDRLEMGVFQQAFLTLAFSLSALTLFHYSNRTFKNASLYWGYGVADHMSLVAQGKLNRFDIPRLCESITQYLELRRVWLERKCLPSLSRGHWCHELDELTLELPRQTCS